MANYVEIEDPTAPDDMPVIKGGGVLGEKVTGPRRVLDVFELPRAVSTVSYHSDEVTSLCPITGQPDWYDVTIDLATSRLGIESKSLKLYLQSFRDGGQFCEQFADTIAHDVRDATHARSVRVTVTQRPRGGVGIEARATLVGDVEA